MPATKILWGQILVVFAIVLATIWAATQWIAWRLDVKMDDVEIIGALAHLPQHGERAAKMIGNSCKPETLRRANDEVRFRLRSSAREQDDLVALADKFFRQPGNTS